MNEQHVASARVWAIASGALIILALLTACDPLGGSGPAAQPRAGGDPTTSVTPPASLPTTSPPVRPGELTTAALVQPADLGTDWRVETEQLRGDFGLGMVGAACWGEGSNPADGHRNGFLTRGLTTRPASVEAAENDGFDYVAVELRSYEPGWAHNSMTEWAGRASRPCHFDGTVMSLTVVETGFAGDESILFRFDGANQYQAYLGLVRRGEATAFIRSVPERDRDLVRRAATGAARRLCAVATC